MQKHLSLQERHDILCPALTAVDKNLERDEENCRCNHKIGFLQRIRKSLEDAGLMNKK